MTGTIVSFGGGQPPSADDPRDAIDAAKASLPEHDPLHEVLASQRMLVDAMERATARIESGPIERPLPQLQLDRVAQSASHGAQHGLRLMACTIDRMTAAVAIGGAILAASVAGIGVYSWTAGRDIDTKSALDWMRADDAAVLAKLVRLNPGASKWTFEQQQTLKDGSRGGWVLLRIEPLQPTTPAAH